ncbi:MAG: AMP-binding protein [Gammaproteobacteria bacterium]|nr:AMP-binding protein [Gammaproteobacteria bacterium]
MTRGLSRDQIGVSEEMVATYGELVFKLSHNHQIRRGDPVRLKQFDLIATHRGESGMSDGQIAECLGLTLNQVTLIRNLEERRRFNRAPYHRLNQLGGGRRFRTERFTDPASQHRYDEDATLIRCAIRFDPDLVKRYVEAGWWCNETLRSWLAQRAEATPGAPALLGPDGAVQSYGALSEQVRRLAAGLYAKGLRPGDVLSIQLPNTADFLRVYLAATHLGAVVSTLYLPHRKSDMRRLLGAARARMLVCATQLGDFAPAATAVAMMAELDHLSCVIAVEQPVAGAITLAELDADEPDPPQAPVGSDPFLLLFTSGTTAQPKAVPLTYQNMLSNARLSAPEHQLTASDRILSAAPFGHLYALYSFHLALATGAANVLLPIFTPPALAEAVQTHRPTALFAGPAHMQACLANGLIDAERWRSLRLIVLSGATLPPALAHQLAAALPSCARITQLWGMTETQAGLYTRPGDPIDIAATSAGRPSPGTEVRIADSDDREVGHGTEGELQIRGALLFPGYLANDEANAAAFTADHWFRSGDLAVRSEDGNVTITGRIKEIINRGGVKYNPREIEDLLDAHPAIAQCAIVPMADAALGERACCFAVATPGAMPTLEELTNYLLEHGVAKFKLPERLELRDALPMTPTRKIIKGQLRVD